MSSGRRGELRGLCVEGTHATTKPGPKKGCGGDFLLAVAPPARAGDQHLHHELPPICSRPRCRRAEIGRATPRLHANAVGVAASPAAPRRRISRGRAGAQRRRDCRCRWGHHEGLPKPSSQHCAWSAHHGTAQPQAWTVMATEALRAAGRNQRVPHLSYRRGCAAGSTVRHARMWPGARRHAKSRRVPHRCAPVVVFPTRAQACGRRMIASPQNELRLHRHCSSLGGNDAVKKREWGVDAA